MCENRKLESERAVGCPSESLALGKENLVERWHTACSKKTNNVSPSIPLALKQNHCDAYFCCVGGVSVNTSFIPYDAALLLLGKYEYKRTGLKHKEINVQIQETATQMARHCTTERDKRQMFLPQTFFSLAKVVRTRATPRPVLQNSPHCTLKPVPGFLHLNAACFPALRQHNHTDPSDLKKKQKTASISFIMTKKKLEKCNPELCEAELLSQHL